MPLETNFNTSPYFDDYSDTSDYYKVLFKPGVAVQTREINQLQTILQKQIERFGDHVFKSGTIISGVNFRYISNYQYVKINDLQVDGQPVAPAAYSNYFVRNSANVQARVVNYQTGFQSRDPDLNTLFLQYVNSGNDNSTGTFSNGDVLTVFSQNNPVFEVVVNNGGSGFSNSDSLVVVSALTINVSSGAFTAGETITQSTTGALATVIEANTTALTNQTVLKIKPRNTDLANTSANASVWSFETGYNVVGGSSGAVANVISLVGSGATGVVVTDSLGVVNDIVISSANGTGSNYTVPPHVTIKPTSNTASVSTLSLTPLTYKAQVRVANSSFSDPVGAGYAFSVTEGIIYQKGHFLRVVPQVIIVDKYSSSPNNVSVGFSTLESIDNVNSNTSLYDNAANTTNFNAPGADRLRLAPTLTVVNTNIATSNVEFFTLVEFKEGAPYKENRNTVYNTLGTEFARRTSETSGDFVVDPFVVMTKDKDTINATSSSIVIDPGLAYISGYRVETLRNTYIDYRKATDTIIRNNQSITANYGNYVLVNELAGNFNFKTGDQVSLYDTAQQFITNRSFPTGTAISPSGNSIGTARVRSLVFDSGTAGTPSAVYRLYLFDIVMSTGQSFKDVKSIYYNGTNDGVCDTVQEVNPSTSANVAVLKDTNNNVMLFNTGLNAVKVANDVSFTYRYTEEAATLAIDGTSTISLITSGETFPYTAESNLSQAQKAEVIVTPLANAESSSNTGGTITTLTTSPTISGLGTTFISDFDVGDHIKLQANATAIDIRRIITIANNTSMTLDANVAFANAATKAKLFYPAFYPISLTDRSNRTVNTGAGSTTLTIDIDDTLSAPVTSAVTYNIRVTNAAEITKSVNRDVYVKLYTANNAGATIGPWSLGIPDAVRLKNVYLGNTASDVDITKHFYVDQGHDGNHFGLAHLVKKTGSSLTLGGTQWLLVKLDAFTSSGEGFGTVSSYNIDDTKTLAASSNTVNTFEIPEVITNDRRYFDLRDTFDFRPVVANTAALANTVAGATINPANTETYNSNIKYFPTPDSAINFDAEVYLGRVDRVIAKKDGTFQILEGVASINSPQPPKKPVDSVTLSLLDTRPYPTLPLQPSANTIEIINKFAGNETGEINSRTTNYTANVKTNVFENLQTQTYTMKDISNLERRIKQLEYYVSLTLLEQDIKDLVIPSSVNPLVNRFKHGFSVDDFDDYTFADQYSKEFLAFIAQDRSVLQPFTKQMNLEAQFNRADVTTNNSIYQQRSVLLPYNEEELVTQQLATSVVGSDGTKTSFNGEMRILPSSFSIRIRGEVRVTPDPPANNGGGGGGGSFYLCTAMRDLGYMDDDTWEADHKFGYKLRTFDSYAFDGYEWWALPLADYVRGEGRLNKLTLNIIKPFILLWARDMARREGYNKKASIVGYVMMEVGMPICRVLGRIRNFLSKKVID